VHIAAEENAITLGSGFKDLSPLNMSYIIQRFGADITRLPGYGEDVVIRTWPSAINSGVFVRTGDMYDADGVRLMNWVSLWVLFNLETRKILKSSALPRQFSGVDMPGMTAKASKIVLPEGWGEPFSSYSHTVRYNEVDTNRHMNNSIYGDLTGNALYIRENPLAEDWAEVQINFLAETMLGDEMDITCRYGNAEAEAEVELTEPSNKLQTQDDQFGETGSKREEPSDKLQIVRNGEEPSDKPQTQDGLFWVTGRKGNKYAFMATVRTRL
jgi:acyl-ACP thioesterase